MKLLQLRYVLEVHRHGNHISNTAEALHTSQPGISKHIQQIEAELGFEIFARKRNRIVGLTEAGREVVTIAKRVIGDIDNLKRLGEEISARDTGSLSIATTHTQARYVLPKVIERFIQRHPNVRLHLRQGNPTQICEMVESGETDIAIGTETMRKFPALVRLECFELERIVIVKAGHPLLKIRKPTLHDVAAYPIITHDPAFSGRWKVMEAFQKVGIEPNIVFGAVDADVSKTYVELGMGIAVMTAISYDRRKDQGLRAIDASHLFKSSMLSISLRANSYLRNHTYDFLRMFTPRLTKDYVRDALEQQAETTR
ncbi:CysB family HTH-type transcriptional regulator [Hydrogenophaga sp. BPS33]|uniref:CysB family HTH-type transcriptional regulator n=1 Tax=Hydrogenophaga sp. BPS33 TaxID=2651974 RepID=UPI00131FC763|nr:CysB family HTH-type transcriptional regulator [Hydrogenophaga sp. BPS33]QHE86882.1 CysB family HTH-type transcriptional regulator [Hydrogenophaga sp. BPS33]